MSRSPEPLFLARRSYVRRRAEDATRLLPFAGICLLLVPVLFDPVTPARTANVILYLFGVWALLIVLAAQFARRLRQPPRSDTTPGSGAANDTTKPDAP